MAWRMVRQPNGKLARFSDVVDDFTHYNLSDAEAWNLCRDAGGVEVAIQKIANADANPHRFHESIETIRSVHGELRADHIELELNKTTCTVCGEEGENHASSCQYGPKIVFEVLECEGWEDGWNGVALWATEEQALADIGGRSHERRLQSGKMTDEEFDQHYKWTTRERKLFGLNHG